MVVKGQYGHVWLKLEPLGLDDEYEFVDKIVGGVVPKEYIPAVDKGIQEQMKNGVIAGYPLCLHSEQLYMMGLSTMLIQVRWLLK